ncbi:unnamed protein product [Camellia sinensis]
MAVEGDVVQRLSLAQRNPKHLDALGGFIIFVALTMLSLLEKTNIESMNTSFFSFKPVDNDDDGDDNEDRCQRLRFFFPG